MCSMFVGGGAYTMFDKVIVLCAVLTCCLRASHGVANLVLLSDAVTDGAVCLDGSPSAYYFRPGSLNKILILKREVSLHPWY